MSPVHDTVGLTDELSPRIQPSADHAPKGLARWPWWKTLRPIVFLLASFPLLSQVGQIAGTVTDPDRATVVGAKVTATNVATRSVAAAITDDTGRYEIVNVAPGNYRVEVQVRGFNTAGVQSVMVTSEQLVTLDIRLDIASPHASVTVSGTPSDDFSVEEIEKVGPFSQTPLQDLPYSINVMSLSLIEDLQASTVDQLYRINPFIQSQVPQTRSGSGIGYIRGFNVAAQREDGLFSAFPIVDIEDKQEVEVLTGQSGFLYGINPPGGLVNYILKRPTAARYNSVDFGTYGGASLYGHADLGGPIDHADKFGYRLNMVAQGGGDTAIEHENVTRFLGSGALDWRVARNATLQFDSSGSSYRVDGSPAVWQFVSLGPPPPPPSADKLWGQKFDFSKYVADKEGARFNWNLNRIFTVRAGFARMGYKRSDFYTNNQIDAGNASYNIIAIPFAPRFISTYSGQAFVDAAFRTGFVKHKLTLGFDGSDYDEKRHQDQSAVLTLGTGDFTIPLYLQKPSYKVGAKPLVNFGETLATNFLLGDVMELAKSWMVVAGVSNAGVVQSNFSLATAQLSARYDKRAWTPTASLIYKPVDNVSTYFTYIEGLQQGGTAPATAVNAGVQLPPDLSHQYEVGVKASLGKAFLTVALFDIKRAFEYTDPSDNVFKAAGREDHKGAEFGITGKVTRHLNLFGGFTLLRPRITDDVADPTLNGRIPTNVAERLFKLYAEYEVPPVRGLALTAGIYYTGSSSIDTNNFYKLPAFTTGDAGLKYERRIEETPIIFRINVTNLANRSYWTSVTGGNLYTGAPRSVATSIQVRF